MSIVVILLLIVILIVFIYLQNKNENFTSCVSKMGCFADYSGNILHIMNLGDSNIDLNDMGPINSNCDRICINYERKRVRGRMRRECVDHGYKYNGITAKEPNVKDQKFNNYVVSKIKEKNIPDNKFILVQAFFGDFDLQERCRYPQRQIMILYFKANNRIYRLENSGDPFVVIVTLTNGNIDMSYDTPGTKNNRHLRYNKLINEDKKNNLTFKYYHTNNSRIMITYKNGKEFEDMRFDLVPVP